MTEKVRARSMLKDNSLFTKYSLTINLMEAKKLKIFHLNDFFFFAFEILQPKDFFFPPN